MMNRVTLTLAFAETKRMESLVSYITIVAGCSVASAGTASVNSFIAAFSSIALVDFLCFS